MIGWLLHWLAVHTGTLNEPGPYYGFWSGFGSDIGEVVLIGGMIGLYRKHNCHVKGCWRIARHPVPGTAFIVCRRHLPGEAPSHQEVIDAHHAAKRRHSGESGERMHAGPPPVNVTVNVPEGSGPELVKNVGDALAAQIRHAQGQWPGKGKM